MQTDPNLGAWRGRGTLLMALNRNHFSLAVTTNWGTWYYDVTPAMKQIKSGAVGQCNPPQKMWAHCQTSTGQHLKSDFNIWEAFKNCFGPVIYLNMRFLCRSKTGRKRASLCGLQQNHLPWSAALLLCWEILLSIKAWRGESDQQHDAGWLSMQPPVWTSLRKQGMGRGLTGFNKPSHQFI